MSDTLIITTVGTSLLTAKPFPTILKKSVVEQARKCVEDNRNNKDYPGWVDKKAFAKALSKEGGGELQNAEPFYGAFIPMKAAEMIQNRGEKNKSDELPAELSSLYLLLNPREKDSYSVPKPTDGTKHRVVLLTSDTPEGVFCGRCIADYINENDALKSDLEVQDDDIIIIKGLVGEEATSFQTQGLNSLVEAVVPLVTDKRYERIVLNLTGGYKGSIPYLTLLGVIYPNVDIVYLYEQSKAVVAFPKLPVDFDIIEWNNHRGVIRAINQLPNKEQLLKILPPDLEHLFREMPQLGEAIQKRVDEKEKGLSAYGSGYILTGLIKDPNLKQTVEKWIDGSRHIWYGDLIAETVDHARGHAQRLQEMAYQILKPILQHDSEFLSDDEIALLIYTLWIHDIGHSGRKVKLCDGNGKEFKPEVLIDIGPFPSLVRELHHYTAYLMLTTDGEWQRYFKPDVFGNDENRAKNLAKSVAVCYLYHRGKMNILDKKDTTKGEEFFETAVNVREFFSYPLITFVENHPELQNNHNWELIVAIQRLVDGCDVQKERTFGGELEKRKQDSNEQEIKLEKERLGRLITAIRKELNDDDNETYKQFLTAQKSWLEDLEKCYKEYKQAKEENNATNLQKKAKELNDLQKQFERKGIVNGNENSSLYALLREVWKKRQSGNEASIDILFEEYLSCLDKIVWKHTPPPHFAKHRSLDGVFFEAVKDEHLGQNGTYTFWINLVESKELDVIEEQINEVCLDIKEEYTKGGVEKVFNGNKIKMVGIKLHEKDGSVRIAEMEKINKADKDGKKVVKIGWQNESATS